MEQSENTDDWQPWIEEACRAVGVDPALVDAAAILALTKTVAQRFVRPMGPVAAHILGLAVGAQGAEQSALLTERLEATLSAAEG